MHIILAHTIATAKRHGYANKPEEQLIITPAHVHKLRGVRITKLTQIGEPQFTRQQIDYIRAHINPNSTNHQIEQQLKHIKLWPTS